MKKVLVMALALAMFAAPAMANVANSKHNLSAMNLISGAGSDELCIYCHTPHAALSANNADIPLWNLKATADTSGGPIGSSVCMACHDGNLAFADISNPTNGSVAGAGTLTFTANGNLLDGANGLTNDHPVGFTYVIGGDANFNTEAVLVAAGAKLSTDNKVECFSCHNVHDYTNSPFLITSNSASALCVACHIK